MRATVLTIGACRCRTHYPTVHSYTCPPWMTRLQTLWRVPLPVRPSSRRVRRGAGCRRCAGYSMHRNRSSWTCGRDSADGEPQAPRRFTDVARDEASPSPRGYRQRDRASVAGALQSPDPDPIWAKWLRRIRYRLLRGPRAPPHDRWAPIAMRRGTQFDGYSAAWRRSSTRTEPSIRFSGRLDTPTCGRWLTGALTSVCRPR